MKTMKFFAIAAIMMAAGALSVNAQERVVTLDQLKQAKQNQNTTVNNNNNRAAVSQSSSYAASPANWSSAYVQYNISTLKTKAEGGGHSVTDNEGFSAISLGYNMAFGLFGDLPLYLQPGVALTYGWDSEEAYDVKTKSSMMYARIPVNLVYSFQIPNSPISIDPYLGINGRAFIFANAKEDGHDSHSFFSEDDMGKDHTWNRFQIGAQVGVNVRFNQFYVGAEYAMDATEVYKHDKNGYKTTEKINAFSISLGYCF